MTASAHPAAFALKASQAASRSSARIASYCVCVAACSCEGRIHGHGVSFVQGDSHIYMLRGGVAICQCGLWCPRHIGGGAPLRQPRVSACQPTSWNAASRSGLPPKASSTPAGARRVRGVSVAVALGGLFGRPLLQGWRRYRLANSFLPIACLAGAAYMTRPSSLALRWQGTRRGGGWQCLGSCLPCPRAAIEVRYTMIMIAHCSMLGAVPDDVRRIGRKPTPPGAHE